MAVNYEAKEWKNDSVGNTPITAEELNRIDSGVAQVAEAVNALDEPGNVTTTDIADGAVTADKLSQEVRDSVSQVRDSVSHIETGKENIDPTPGEVTTREVTFSSEFASTPVVVVSPISTVPNIISATAGSITRSGFTIYLHRTTATQTQIAWMAVETA